MEQRRKWIERLVEGGLWGSRWTILVAVVFSLLIVFGAIYMATVDTWLLLQALWPYADPTLSPEVRDSIRSKTVTRIIKAVDGYLIASILLIFAFGLYELFIRQMDTATRHNSVHHRMQIRSVDDLKDRIVRLILLVMIIEFFQQALRLKYDTPLELLYFALGVLFIGGSLYLSKPAKEE
jgi:uncharacterized membrane protein YqhA